MYRQNGDERVIATIATKAVRSDLVGHTQYRRTVKVSKRQEAVYGCLLGIVTPSLSHVTMILDIVSPTILS